jgi:heme exporter protein D
MITTAITAIIVGVLNFFGIPPGPYVPGVWIAVKVMMVGMIALIVWRTTIRRKRVAATSA